MSNKEIFEFIKNLPYKYILVCIGLIFVMSLIAKIIRKSNIFHIPKEKVRSFWYIIEFISVFIFIIMFRMTKVNNSTTLSLVTFAISIFEFLNFNIIYSYFLEKAANLFFKIWYFILSLLIALIPSFIFVFVIVEISILLI